MNVTLRQLQAFVLLSETGSFTQAAQRMFITQSGLSLMVRELETALNAKLVNRTTRHLSLTAVGNEFLPNAQRVLADVAHAVGSVDKLLAKARGRVIIAAPLVLSGTFLSEVIAGFRRTYPDIELVLKDCLPDHVLPLVRNGAADLGIGTFHHTHDDLTREFLFKESLVAVFRHADVGMRSPSTRREPLRWADLADKPILVLPRGSIFRDLAEAGFTAAGITLQPSLEATYVGTLLGMVRAGLGVAIVPGYATALGDENQLDWRRLITPAIEREVVMVHRSGIELPPAAQALAEHLRAAAPKARRSLSAKRRARPAGRTT